MKLFSPDSPVGRVISLLADLVALNLLFLFSCMPVITVGAACGALYHTVHAMLAGQGGVVSREYFRSFRSCFVRGTVLFLISVVVLAMVLADYVLATGVVGIMGLLCVGVILGSLIIVLGVMAHLPILLSRNPKERLGSCLREGVLLTVRNGWRTLAAVVLNVTVPVLFLFLPGLFVRSWMFWFLVGFAAVAYVNNWLLLPGVDPECWEQLKPVKKEK